jgi:hypothetical protein
MIITAILATSSSIIGYIICYLLGLRLLKKLNIRNYTKSFFCIEDFCMLEYNLKASALRNDDPRLTQILRIIKYSKLSIVINVFLFLIFGVLNMSALP